MVASSIPSTKIQSIRKTDASSHITNGPTRTALEQSCRATDPDPRPSLPRRRTSILVAGALVLAMLLLPAALGASDRLTGSTSDSLFFRSVCIAADPPGDTSSLAGDANDSQTSALDQTTAANPGSAAVDTDGVNQASVAKVVASTAWTGLIARAAGAADVSILAPMDLKHPPEYDYKASDVAKVASSAFVVWAGYEPFISKLLAAANVPQNRVIRIVTTNTPESLKAQARLVADILGTQAEERSFEQSLDLVADEILAAAKSHGVPNTRVLVQTHQQAYVAWLGYDIVGVFGAEEMSPSKVAEYARLKPDLIIDNYHNPQGKAIAELVGCRYVELINFPGPGIDSLQSLLRENAKRLGLVE